MGLLFVGDALGAVIKEANLEQPLVLLATKDILKDSLVASHTLIAVELFDPLGNLLGVIRVGVIGLVEPSPGQAAHLLFDLVKNGRHPVDNGREVGLDCLDVLVIAVLGHVTLNVALAHPVQGALPEVLTID